MSKVLSKFIFFFGLFVGILFGYDIGIIVGVEGYICEVFYLSLFWLGIVVLLLMGGVIIGFILSGLLGDKFGWRKLILILLIIFFLGFIGLVIVSEEIMLMIVCVFLGIVVGMVFLLVFVYMLEIVFVNICGKFLGLN